MKRDFNTLRKHGMLIVTKTKFFFSHLKTNRRRLTKTSRHLPWAFGRRQDVPELLTHVKFSLVITGMRSTANPRTFLVSILDTLGVLNQAGDRGKCSISPRIDFKVPASNLVHAPSFVSFFVCFQLQDCLKSYTRWKENSHGKNGTA